MIKTATFFVAILFSSLCVCGQTNPSTSTKVYFDASFCGQVGADARTKGQVNNYSLKELQECDFIIRPVDSNFTVTDFQVSYVGKDKLHPYTEKK